MRTNLLIICVLSICVSGCTNFYVSDQNNNKGVPFYIKKGVIKQTTEYTRTYIVATLEYQELDSPNAPKTADFYINPNEYREVVKKNPKFMENVLSAAKKGNNFEETVTKVADHLKTEKLLLSLMDITYESNISFKGEPNNLYESLISNTVVEEAKVDYEHPYYFNTYFPLFATSTANIKIANDGTITEASTTIDTSKLAEDILPLKEVLLDVLGVRTVNLDRPTARLLSYNLSMDGYRYKLTKYHELGKSIQLPLEFKDAESIVRTSYNEKTEE